MIFAYIGLNKAQYRLFPIKKLHPEQQVIALDLIGMIVEKPELYYEFPNMSAQLNDNYMDVYRPGAAWKLWWGKNKLLKTRYDPPFYNKPPIIDEYKKAVKK